MIFSLSSSGPVSGERSHLGAIARALPSEASPKGARAYLVSLTSPASRQSMRYALDQVARILTGDEDADFDCVPWNRLRYEHMTALRSRLVDHYAPGSANTMIAAVRAQLSRLRPRNRGADHHRKGQPPADRVRDRRRGRCAGRLAETARRP